MKHRIKHSKGGTVELDLTRNRAIKAFCTECMGWETHPKDCAATLCPLYPYRASL